MRYAYKDLGRQAAGTNVTVKLEGSSANVLLLDSENFSRYRARGGFRYTGGLYTRSTVTLSVPRDGHWYLVVDMGGYGGRVRARIQGIDPPDAERSQRGDREEAGLEAVS